MRAHHVPTTTRTSLAGLVVAVMAATLLTVAPAGAQDRGAQPQLQTRETATVVAGDTTWVALNWLGTGEARDVRVRVVNPSRSSQASWAYPENTGEYTAPSKDATLQRDELDYTALQITVPYDQAATLTLDLQVTWTEGRLDRSESYTVAVPVTSFDGEDLQQVTQQVQVTRGEDTWVEVKYTGGAPRLEDFSVRAVVDTEGGIVYPGDGDSSSLHHDDILLAEETDVARFLAMRSLAEDLGPSEFVLPLEVSYTKGQENVTQTFDLTVQIE